MGAEGLRDITDIPQFAFAPGLGAWLLFCAFSALTVYLALRFSKRGQKRKLTAAFDRCLGHLSALQERAPDIVDVRELLYMASIETRRLLSITSKREISALTPSEIRKIAKDSTNDNLRSILAALLEVEELKYAPPTKKNEAENILQGLRAAVFNYHQTLQTP